MPIRLHELSLSLDQPEEMLTEKAAKKLGISATQIKHIRIVRQSLDARRKSDLRLKFSVEVSLSSPKEEKRHCPPGEIVDNAPAGTLEWGKEKLPLRPIVVGTGPCGLFCAYLLAEYGFQPLIIERGSALPERERQFAELQNQGVFHEQSNVCFGEGGAGTFSDGKLTTRIKDPRVRRVLEIFHEAGAPREITYLAKPHMGTEHIRLAVKNLREKACAMGAEFRFDTKLSDVQERDGKYYAQLTGNHAAETVPYQLLIAAIGSSARDTIELFLARGVPMVKRPFAMGVRIEHPREMIDQVQYGAFMGHPRLGAAEYRLSTKAGERGVYTFCMCPGGEVINSSCEDGCVSVNGMSGYRRDAQNSNSAVVVTVSEQDMPGGILAGIELQRHWEKICYRAAEGYGAPAQRLEDFFTGKISSDFPIAPSIRPYAKKTDLNDCLPAFLTQALKQGLHEFGRMFRGFDCPDAVLTAIESKTSACVRILRDENFQSSRLGILPAGEGAGYAGGIVSAAVDGLKIAESIITRYRPDY